jgi:uncharacterized protein (TIRG00374 family)
MPNPSTHPNGSFSFSKLFKKLIIIIPIGIIINLVITFSGSDRSILKAIGNFSPGYFSLAIMLILLPWFANTLRLYIWTQFLGTKLSFIQAFKIIILSEFGAAMSPSAVGSAPVKTGLLIEQKMKPGAALTIASLTSLEDFTFFIVAIPTALTLSSAWGLPFLNIFFKKMNGNLPWIAGLLISIVLGVFITLKIYNSRARDSNSRKQKRSFIQKIRIKAKKVWREFKAAYKVIGKKGKFRFFLTTTLTGIQWICRYSVITALVISLGFQADPILFFALQWIVFTLAVFIPTPGATGGAEASFYLIFYSFIPHQALGLVTAGWRFLAFYSFLGIGLLLYFMFDLIQKKMKKSYQRVELILVEQDLL